MLFQEMPALTTNYMLAGFIVIFGVILLYIVSLLVRQKNLRQDLEVLSEEESQPHGHTNQS